MIDLQLIAKALPKALELRSKYTANSPFGSLVLQLEYLDDLGSGRIADSTRLKDVNIGLLAIREVEELDPELAQILLQIMHGVRQRLEWDR